MAWSSGKWCLSESEWPFYIDTAHTYILLDSGRQAPSDAIHHRPRLATDSRQAEQTYTDATAVRSITQEVTSILCRMAPVEHVSRRRGKYADRRAFHDEKVREAPWGASFGLRMLTNLGYGAL